MKTTSVRLYGAGNLRLESFDLPEINDDEVLVKIVSDSLCMSTYKAQKLGTKHARVPKDVEKNPIIVGHEMCGDIIKVGKNWQKDYRAGDKFTLQPALPNGEMNTVGYAWHYCGGNATYAIIPELYIKSGCLLNYTGDSYFPGSIAEPMSCVVGGFKVNYHNNFHDHTHAMGIVKDGNTAILAGAGPMGLGAIDYAINNPGKRPKLLVVTDINEERLSRAKKIFQEKTAKQNGIRLVYLNTAKIDAVTELLKLSGGKGYDDVFVYAPVDDVCVQADKILAFDGCLNFFAGPTDNQFSAMFNYYNVHYKFTHVASNTGGNTADMIESLKLSAEGKINPAVMVTHIGGLDSAIEATMTLPDKPAGKKLVYTHKKMPMTAIVDFKSLGKTNPFYAELHRLCEKSNGLWNAEAEKFLLDNAKELNA